MIYKIAKLKSGGPDMLILAASKDEKICVWFDECGSMDKAIFSECMLNIKDKDDVVLPKGRQFEVGDVVNLKGLLENHITISKEISQGVYRGIYFFDSNLLSCEFSIRDISFIR